MIPYCSILHFYKSEQTNSIITFRLDFVGFHISMYLCISTVVDFNSQNFDPPNEI